MERWQGKVAIVTGASSGIGAAIAEQLVQHGMIVVGIARREEKIKELAEELKKAPGKLYAIKADLRKEEEVLSAFSWIEKELKGADVLVNNAGAYKRADFADGNTEDWRLMLELNVLALCICTREYLKSMKVRNQENGHIFNINGVVGHVVGPGLSPVYQATKFAVTAISRSLRADLCAKGIHIKVTSLSPGATVSEVLDETPVAGKIDELRNTLGILEAKDVALALVSALATPAVTQIAELVITPITQTVIAY